MTDASRVDAGDSVRDTWYVAMWSADVRPGAVVARTILDEPIVFWRTGDGRVVALADRCPHRAAPLSLGDVRGDVIRCRYHGLQYDASGACVRNPHPNQVIPPGMQTASYPVIERHSMVWIWIGEHEPDATTIPDFGILDTAPPARVSARDYLLMQANVELIADNLLDLSHASFLHEGTGLYGIHLLTPQSATTTHYHFCAVRQNAGGGVEDEETREKISALRHRAFDEQDRAMIEAQQRNLLIGRGDWKPSLLSVDAGAVHRRVLASLKAARGNGPVSV